MLPNHQPIDIPRGALLSESRVCYLPQALIKAWMPTRETFSLRNETTDKISIITSDRKGGGAKRAALKEPSGFHPDT